MSSTDVLKNSIKILYQDYPDVLYVLDQIDFTELTWKWEAELFSRINKETYEKVENYLASEEYSDYSRAVSEASMAMSRPLADLMVFVLDKRKGEVN